MHGSSCEVLTREQSGRCVRNSLELHLLLKRSSIAIRRSNTGPRLAPFASGKYPKSVKYTGNLTFLRFAIAITLFSDEPLFKSKRLWVDTEKGCISGMGSPKFPKNMLQLTQHIFKG